MAPNKMYSCQICDKTFAQSQSLNRHKRTSHRSQEYNCNQCKLNFTRKDNWQRHMKSMHPPAKHVQIGGGAVDDEQRQLDNPCRQEALKGTMKVYTIPGEGVAKYDPMTFLRSHFEEVKSILKKAVTEKGAMKWYLAIKVKMTRRRGDMIDTAEPVFRGKCQTALKWEDLEEGMRGSIKKIYTSFIEYQREGSNWTVDKVLDLIIHTAKYRPLRGSSYLPLPIKLRSKYAIINVKNRDKKCFLWSVLAALHNVQNHAERIAKYKPYVGDLNFKGINFPVKLGDIPKFESQNEISINVFGYEKGQVFPLHISKEQHERCVNLLLISKGKKTHYCWIKNMSRLLAGRTKHDGKAFYCPYCLHGFTKEKLLQSHIPYCQTHGPQRVELPKEEDKWLSYQLKHVKKQLKAPYILFADFESLQVPISSCAQDPNLSSTEKLTKHLACGFAYKVVGLTTDHSKPPVIHRGLDAAEKFVDYMIQEQEDIVQKFKQGEPLHMTGCDWQNFKKATHCHICQKPLGSEKPVRDHCHVTGKFRGAAHSVCNQHYKFTGRIPVVFHNLRGYDSHLIMQAIGKIQNKEINCIPNNMEKYISFSLGCMDFIDSYQFMNSSLETLVKNLAKEGPAKFNHMAQQFDPERLPLLLRKQVYPYEYFDSEQRFSETTLPPKEAFYSSLSGEDVSIEDYNHAQAVWDAFGLQNLGQYHDLYVLTDVLALADVFENFRNLCLDAYGLDPAHFYTSPGLAWLAALKMTGVQLELLTDIDQHLFVEQGLRGGISMISHRYAKANHPNVPGYNPEQPNNHILYLDANNLYGWAMSQSLPVSGFEWVHTEDFPDVTQVLDNAQEGYILEVDLDYPKELHDHHNDYPLAPESIGVTDDMLSPFAMNLKRKLEDDLRENKDKNKENRPAEKQSECTKDIKAVQKLIPNLQPKQKYVLHYRNLKFYLSLGMKLSKVHRVLKFQQQGWLKAYIEFNTERRKQAKNDFEKDFWKLMNNAVFGKTMENLRKRVDVKLVQGPKRAQKLIAKPSFQAFRIFNENLVAVHLKKQKLYLNRPIYAGFSILDISKILMYDFHYNFIKLKYGARAQLLFTDTDSLCYSIQTDDVYADMLEDRDLFDTSEYHNDHPLYSTKNKKVLGKMKDETHGLPIQEFVGLKSKMYSLVYEKEESLVEKKTAKGVKKCVIKHHTKHAHYKQCLFEREAHMSTMTQIRSFGHELYNIQLNKRGLSPFDDKRYLLEGGVASLAYGHWRISL
ncbi:uncharacterized protein [Haliotis cracherodii]|uniref:uncharacterized protein n=1 Tax=Haliotis cracherodii TaxID=6455 RepID=UPI0039EA5CB9